MSKAVTIVYTLCKANVFLCRNGIDQSARSELNGELNLLLHILASIAILAKSSLLLVDLNTGLRLTFFTVVAAILAFAF